MVQVLLYYLVIPMYIHRYMYCQREYCTQWLRSKDHLLQVPLGVIEGIETQAVKETLTFLCRDARSFK